MQSCYIRSLCTSKSLFSFVSKACGNSSFLGTADEAGTLTLESVTAGELLDLMVEAQLVEESDFNLEDTATESKHYDGMVRNVDDQSAKTFVTIPLPSSQMTVETPIKQYSQPQPCCQKFQKCFTSGRASFSQLSAARHHFTRHKKLLPGCMSQILRQTATAAGAAAHEIPVRAQKIVGGWLLTCAGMCVGAVILGGVTRLTESGLSMVDWRLLKDMKPPGSQQEWEEEFERYKQYPEYKYVAKEKEMTLSDFKFIYYMEWAHRMWGRGVGLVFAIPALYFWQKGWLSKGMKPRVAVYAAVIGFQGFLGWYMVKSGLVDQPESTDIPRVSQYRLASHLGSALLLYTLFLWNGLSHVLPASKIENFAQLARTRGMAHGLMAVVFTTALSGAFVAGLDAGLTYNTWPKMADKWVPDDMWAISPAWKNIFENATTVQFNHRYLAETTIVLIGGFWFMVRKYPLPRRARLAVNCLLGMALLQGTLGILTLLWYVPTHLAATHQSGSVALLSIATWLAHELKRMPK